MAMGEPYEEGMVTAELDYDELRLTRQHRPIFRDTRTDILEELVEAWMNR